MYFCALKMKKRIYSKIEKAAVSKLPKVQYPGKIVVVLTEREAEQAVDYLLAQPILGLDTETRPSFHRGKRYKCALLQVASRDYCFLFRLNHIGLAPAVVRLLEDCTVRKVALAWKNDLVALRELGAFSRGEFIDIQDVVAKIGIQDQSLVKIYANLFEERISKNERLSNWERDVLSEQQKAYAAIDAWACIRIDEEIRRLQETGDYELVKVEETVPKDETDIS